MGQVCCGLLGGAESCRLRWVRFRRKKLQRMHIEMGDLHIGEGLRGAAALLANALELVLSGNKFGPAGVEGWIRFDGIAFGVSDGIGDGPVLIHRLDALPPIDPELAANFCATDLSREDCHHHSMPYPVVEERDRHAAASMSLKLQLM